MPLRQKYPHARPATSNGMSERLLVKGLGGKRKLGGEIEVKGAKNAALKAMAAALLFKDTLTIKNTPEIEDMARIADILSKMGASVEKSGNTYRVNCSSSKIKTELPKDISKRLRASIVLTGPILSRFGKVSFSHPGGCVIGKRPIDIFIDGFKAMGAKVSSKDGKYYLFAPGGKLKGAEIFLKNQSVTATETFMISAVLAKGETIIRNAAMEPEIESLGNFLVSCGAKIKGHGSSVIKIKGGGMLYSNGKAYVTMPDRIDAGSFLILGALVGKNFVIKNCDPSHLTSLIEHLRHAGVEIKINKNSISVSAPSKKIKSFNLKTHEYPGFPTDLQAPMAVLLTQAEGDSLVFETIFEGRLSYVNDLVRMGADIKMMDPHRILIKGPVMLRGRSVESPDLRAGLAFIIAAIVAKGESIIHNVYNIDRGYEKIEERLSKIGVDIKRLKN